MDRPFYENQAKIVGKIGSAREDGNYIYFTVSTRDLRTDELTWHYVTAKEQYIPFEEFKESRWVIVFGALKGQPEEYHLFAESVKVLTEEGTWLQ